MTILKKLHKEKSPSSTNHKAKSAAIKGSTTTNSTTTTAKTVVQSKSCHRLTEIVPGLYLGDKARQKQMVDKGVDVLVPLDSIDPQIWEWGFKGQVFAIPIPDGGVLPYEITSRYVNEIITMLKAGKTLAMYCSGGHGRTGFMAAAVVGRLFPGVDSVAYVRNHYCEEAVETREQMDQLEKLLGIKLPHTPSWERWLEPFWGFGDSAFLDMYPCDLCGIYRDIPCAFDQCPLPWPDEVVDQLVEATTARVSMLDKDDPEIRELVKGVTTNGDGKDHRNLGA